MAVDWIFFPVREFGAYQDKWQEINLAGPASPLLSPAFLLPLIREFTDGRELLGVCGKLNAPDAMVILRKVAAGSWETFQPAQCPLGALVKRSDVPIQPLVGSLLAALPGFALVVGITQQDPDLLPRPVDSECLSTLDYIRTARITIEGSFEQYWEARGKNLKHNMKRQRSRLEKDGIKTSLEVVTEPDDIAQAIADYGQLEGAGWKAQGGTAVHPENAQGRFYRAMMENFCRQGRGRVYRYRFNDRMVAVDLCIEADATLVILKTTHDESMKAYSPAFLMRQEAFRTLFEECTIKRIEFYGKLMEWHTKWSDEARTMYHVNYYRWPLLPKLHRTLRGRPQESSVVTASTPAGAATAAGSRPDIYQWRLVPASEFGKHRHAWQAVFSQSVHSAVLEPAFIETLVSVFGSGNELLAICGDEQSPAAVAIVCASGTELQIGERAARHVVNNLTWQTFQPSQAPLGLWINRPGLSWEQLLPGLLEVLPGFPLVLGISQKDPEVCPRPHDHGRIRTLDYVRIARIRVDRPFDDYWTARDSNVKRQIERRLRRLREDGIEPRLEAITDPAAIPGAIEEFGRIESAGWKGNEGTAIHIDNAQGIFYTRLLREFCARGNGAVYRYRFNDATVAMELCVDGGGTMVMLKTTYDETYKTYAPGLLMRREIFASVFACGRFKNIEFLGKLQPWQLKWCDEVRTMYHVNYYRWNWLPEIGEIRRAASRRPSPIATTADGAQIDRIADGTLNADAQDPTYTITVYDNLRDLPAHYEPLFSGAGKASVFYTLPWYRNLIQTGLAPNERLRIYAVETTTNPAVPCAVLPMRYRDAGSSPFGAKTLSGLSNFYTSLFGPVIETDDPGAHGIFAALAAAIVRDTIRWDVVDLHPLAMDSPVCSALLTAFRNAGLLVQTYYCFGNWYLRVRGLSYAEYFETLPAQLKNTLKRKSKQLEKAARSRIVVYQDLASLDEALRAYEQIYAASWKIPEPFPQFIRGLCQTCAESGWLRLGVVYIDDQPAAAQIWIVNAGIASIYKLAYDERYAKLSPGSILGAHLMEHVIDVDKVHEVDYLTGDDAYKKDWMSDRRERWGVVAFNLRTPHGLLAAARHLGGRATKRVIDSVRHHRETKT